MPWGLRVPIWKMIFVLDFCVFPCYLDVGKGRSHRHIFHGTITKINMSNDWFGSTMASSSFYTFYNVRNAWNNLFNLNDLIFKKVWCLVCQNINYNEATKTMPQSDDIFSPSVYRSVSAGNRTDYNTGAQLTNGAFARNFLPCHGCYLFGFRHQSLVTKKENKTKQKTVSICNCSTYLKRKKIFVTRRLWRIPWEQSLPPPPPLRGIACRLINGGKPGKLVH